MISTLEETSPPPAAEQIIRFIKELRRYLLGLFLAVAVFTLGLYFLTPALLDLLQDHLGQELAFFTVAEPILARIKLALFTAAFVLMPVFTLLLWTALAKPFAIPASQRKWFLLFTCLLFYGGAWFCYAITLPYGVKFLLGFESALLKPVISVGEFVTFVSVFILGFGLIFELPIFMVFAARTGLVSRQAFERNRRYAILIITIVAALLTPTPDLINMLLMAVPLYLLYEMGIITLRLLRS
ncbi:MAG: preprotein translocase subunit TatC [Desulfobulbaceae bacterium]|nr:preprotein translocase subunit TatC [Desulfobulbaceae bacterium]